VANRSDITNSYFVTVSKTQHFVNFFWTHPDSIVLWTKFSLNVECERERGEFGNVWKKRFSTRMKQILFHFLKNLSRNVCVCVCTRNSLGKWNNARLSIALVQLHCQPKTS
jgi:hypothetical protein